MKTICNINNKNEVAYMIINLEVINQKKISNFKSNFALYSK